MDDSILLAVVTGFSAVLGSLITGSITYWTATNQRVAAENKRRLKRAYHDIAAFHRLEERYASSLAATDAPTAAAWKRDIRKRLRDEGFDSPSEKATAQLAERSINDLV
ncbi:hypothetical protein [Thermomonas mangrovi]|uniref:hypothetical protein n=1 Tax=Thermomonas mangrovi TaxID=2993316 RepID=UPI002307EFB5|nr:hypothetical protein [Thermomonas mangrovi]